MNLLLRKDPKNKLVVDLNGEQDPTNEPCVKENVEQDEHVNTVEPSVQVKKLNLL